MLSLSDEQVSPVLLFSFSLCSGFDFAVFHLDGVFRVGGFVDASLADREGAHADVLLQHVAVAEQHVLPVQLLQRQRRKSS